LTPSEKAGSLVTASHVTTAIPQLAITSTAQGD